MNAQIFKRIEICILDLIIDLLSKRFNLNAVFTDFSQYLKHKPLFIYSIIVGSTCFGLVAGFIVSVMTMVAR